MIEIPRGIVQLVEVHAREAFPEECCGFLLGFGKRRRRVVEARRARNLAADNRRRRYIIDPLELLHVDDEARTQHLDLIGIYHSHPNHPAKPSEFDRSHAASWYSYIILRIDDRQSREMTAWRFDESSQRFEPEKLILDSKDTAARSRSRVGRSTRSSTGEP